MEKKNTILLTVIAVATLLVAVVGATFAYFTATNSTSGSGGTTDVTTDTVGAVNLKMEAVTINNEVKYPGGFLVVGAKVTATDNDTNNDFDVTYTVNGTITNNTRTPLNWTLYELSTEVTEPTTGCTLEQTQVGDELHYSYADTCAANATITGGTEVTTGTVDAYTDSEVSAAVTAANEALKSSNSGTTTYYYLVVEYPDTDASQDEDQGQTIAAELTNVTGAQAEVAGD